MIHFKDFVPERIKKGGFLSGDKFQHMEDIMTKANQWIGENNCEVVNVETVVLPNIWDEDEEGSEDVNILTSGTNSTHWHQFVRVWYK